MRRQTSRFAAAALLAGAVGVTAALAFGASAALAADGDDDGIGITIEVTPPTATPAPVVSRAPAATTPRGSSTPADSVAPAADAPKPEDGETDLGGILFVGGLTSAYDWSLDPLAGAADASFTVRNVSTSTFTSKVRFWADGPLGNRLSEVADVAVADLKPGELRTVEARLGGIGQSTFVQVHATLTPPKVVDGVTLTSITRDQFVVIPPWGLASLGGLAAVAFAGLSFVQFVRRPLLPVLA